MFLTAQQYRKQFLGKKKVVGKGQKFGNKKVINEYGVFDSIKEADTYAQYVMLLKAGEITNLRRQVEYELIPAQWREEEMQLKTKTTIKRKCIARKAVYTADIVYTDRQGNDVVVDVKGGKATQTEAYGLRKKLMLWRYGIEIKEI